MSELQNKLSFNGDYLWGPDVSAYQMVDRMSPINWKKVKDHGGSFGIMRMSVADYYFDRSCVSNLVAARDAGIDALAVYVVLKPGSSTNGHLDLIKKGLDDIDTAIPGFQPLIFIDDETYRLLQWNQKKKQYIYVRDYTPSEINQKHQLVADEVQKLQGGIDPGYYTYPAFIMDKKGTERERAYLKRFEDRSWLAFYSGSFQQAAALKWIPDNWVPKPLNAAKLKGWQFGANIPPNQLGPTFGAESDDVDVNRWRGTLDELRTLFTIRGKTQPGTPPPAPPPATDPGDYTLGRESMRAEVQTVLNNAQDEIAKL